MMSVSTARILGLNWTQEDVDFSNRTLVRKDIPAPDAPLPDQPLRDDARGVERFVQNRIVSALLRHAEHHGYGLNEISCHMQEGIFTAEELSQLMQLLGSSLQGWGEFDFVSQELWDRVTAGNAGTDEIKEAR